jgi:hypothetical protein
VCDLAYLLLLEQVERQTLADRQVAAFQMVMLGEGGQLPTVAEARQQLDAALIAEPVEATAVDVEQVELRRALGVM